MTTALSAIEGHQDGLLAALPSHIDRDRFYAIVTSVARSRDIAKCQPASAAMAVFSCAKLGLIPDKHTGHAHIVPFKGQAQVIIGYQGFLELARRGRQVGAVHCEVVFQGEAFDYFIDETGPKLRHTPNLEGDRDMKHATHVYCVSQLSNSIARMVKVLTRKQVEQVAKNTGPWRDYPYEMWLKTAVRRAAKTWPMTPELGKAITLDEQAEMEVVQDLEPLGGQQTDVLSASQPLSLDDDEPEAADTVQTGSGNFDPAGVDELMEANRA